MVANPTEGAVGQLQAIRAQLAFREREMASESDAAHFYRGNTSAIGTEKRRVRGSGQDPKGGTFVVFRTAPDAFLANAGFLAVLAQHDRALDARDASWAHFEIRPFSHRSLTLLRYLLRSLRRRCLCRRLLGQRCCGGVR